MKKPHGGLRYNVILPPLVPFIVDPFTDPDDLGNTIGAPGGIPNVPAWFSFWPLGPQPLAGGNFGLISIFPVSVIFDPVIGNTLDAVISVLNESAGPLMVFVVVTVPSASNMAL